MPRNIYTPERGGFVQSSYGDQMATAYCGMIANPSDINLIDSFIAGATADPDGIVAGCGVIETAATDPSRPGVNEQIADLPAAGATADDFAGILVRNEQMGTNAAGLPCRFAGEMVNVLRDERIGGRIWLMLSNGTAAYGGNAFWIISDTTGHGHQVGSFSAAAIGADTVELTNIKFKGLFAAPVGGYIPAKAEIVA